MQRLFPSLSRSSRDEYSYNDAYEPNSGQYGYAYEPDYAQEPRATSAWRRMLPKRSKSNSKGYYGERDAPFIPGIQRTASYRPGMERHPSVPPVPPMPAFVRTHDAGSYVNIHSRPHTPAPAMQRESSLGRLQEAFSDDGTFSPATLEPVTPVRDVPGPVPMPGSLQLDSMEEMRQELGFIDSPPLEGIEPEMRRSRPRRDRAPYVERVLTPVTERGSASYVERVPAPFVEPRRAPYIEREHTPYVDRERTPYVERERTPYMERERAPYERGPAPYVERVHTPGAYVQRERAPYVERMYSPGAYVEREHAPYVERVHSPGSEPYFERERAPYVRRERTPVIERQRGSHVEHRRYTVTGHPDLQWNKSSVEGEYPPVVVVRQRGGPGEKDTYYIVPGGAPVVFEDEYGNELTRLGDFSGNYIPQPMRPVIVEDEFGREICRAGFGDDRPPSSRTRPYDNYSMGSHRSGWTSHSSRHAGSSRVSSPFRVFNDYDDGRHRGGGVDDLSPRIVFVDPSESSSVLGGAEVIRTDTRPPPSRGGRYYYDDRSSDPRVPYERYGSPTFIDLSDYRSPGSSGSSRSGGSPSERRYYTTR